MNETDIIKNILHNQRGIFQIGNTCFFDYMIQRPVNGKFNIGYIRDVPHLQLLDGGFSKNKVEKYYSKHKKMVSQLDAFITMTDSLASQIKNSYDIDKDYQLFQNFPSWLETPVQKRNEFVFIGARPIHPEFDEFFNQLESDSGLSVKTFYYLKGIGKRGVIKGFDYGSRYGLFVNITKFNQAFQCLPRKVLIYAMTGITPVVHSSFSETISMLRKNNVEPIIYSTNAGDGIKEHSQNIISTINKHVPTQIDRRKWCIETRIPELIQKIKQLGGEK